MGGSVRLKWEQSSASSSWLTLRPRSLGLPLRLPTLAPSAGGLVLTLASFLAPLVRPDGCLSAAINSMKYWSEFLSDQRILPAYHN